MDMQKGEAANGPSLLLLDRLRLIESRSSLDVGMDEQKGEKANELPLLPLELFMEILSWLPLKRVLRLKCVCKSLYDRISNPHFIKLHLSHSLQANSNGTLILHEQTFLYTLDFHEPHCHATKLYYPENINLPQPGKLVGSCNGLLCFQFGDQLALCNPLTQSYKILPQFSLMENFCARDSVVEFAYDWISNDYKVLVFCRWRDPMSGAGETFLYSFRTNAWDIIADPPWNWDCVKFPGVVLRNSLHWMDREYKKIRCFDLFTQRYFEIPLPEKLSPGYAPILAVLRQRLCVVTYYFDIWILKHYGMLGFWTRTFRCSSTEWNNLYKFTSSLVCWRSGYLSLACSEDGCKILVALARGPQNFICCDLESREVRKIEFPVSPSKFSAILPWMPSFAPLPD